MAGAEHSGGAGDGEVLLNGVGNALQRPSVFAALKRRVGRFGFALGPAPPSPS